MPPAPELFAAVLRSLLAAIELQRDAGDLAQPPWPAWLLDTIETGGDGYCVHATNRAAPPTPAPPPPLPPLAPRHPSDEAPTRDGGAIHTDPPTIHHTPPTP